MRTDALLGRLERERAGRAVEGRVRRAELDRHVVPFFLGGGLRRRGGGDGDAAVVARTGTSYRRPRRRAAGGDDVRGVLVSITTGATGGRWRGDVCER